jgi:hypothetical protein
VNQWPSLRRHCERSLGTAGSVKQSAGMKSVVYIYLGGLLQVAFALPGPNLCNDGVLARNNELYPLHSGHLLLCMGMH